MNHTEDTRSLSTTLNLVRDISPPPRSEYTSELLAGNKIKNIASTSSTMMSSTLLSLWQSLAYLSGTGETSWKNLTISVRIFSLSWNKICSMVRWLLERMYRSTQHLQHKHMHRDVLRDRCQNFSRGGGKNFELEGKIWEYSSLIYMRPTYRILVLYEALNPSKNFLVGGGDDGGWSKVSLVFCFGFRLENVTELYLSNQTFHN